MDYAVLRVELTTDPLALGYAALTDAQAAAKLDALDTGRTVRRTDIALAEILAVVDPGDLTALPGTPTNAQLSQERRDLAWLTWLFSCSNISLLNADGSDTQVRANLLRLFGAGTGTRTRLATLQTRTVSRAQELGIGVVLAGDVTNARAGVW